MIISITIVHVNNYEKNYNNNANTPNFQNLLKWSSVSGRKKFKKKK